MKTLATLLLLALPIGAHAQFDCSDLFTVNCGNSYNGSNASSGDDFDFSDLQSCPGIVNPGSNPFSGNDVLVHLGGYPANTPTYVTILLNGLSADLDLFVFSGSCFDDPTFTIQGGGFNCVAASHNSGTQNEVLTFLTDGNPSTAYYIIIDGHNEAQISSFELHIACDQSCDNPTPLSCGATYFGNNTNFGNDITIYDCDFVPQGVPDPADFTFYAPDQVFSIVKNEPGDLTLNLFSEGVDLDLFLFDECNGFFFNCTAGSLNSLDNGNLNFDGIRVPNAPPGTYYAVVDGQYANNTGNFELTATCGRLDCGQATFIPCNSSLPDENNFGGENNVSAYCGGGIAGFTGKEKIYYFELLQSGAVTVRLTEKFGANFEIFLFDQCGDNLDCIENTQGGGGPVEEMQVTLFPGTYYIVIDQFFGENGTYDLELYCPTCPDPSFFYDCGVELAYEHLGDPGELLYRFSVPNGTPNYAFGEPWLVNGVPVAASGNAINHDFGGGGQVEVCFPQYDSFDCLNYCCSSFCIQPRPACLYGLVTPSCSSCTTAEPGSPLPTPFQCDDFNGYGNSPLVDASPHWRLFPGTQVEPDLVTFDAYEGHSLEIAGNPGNIPNLLYELYDGNGDDLSCGRYRVSWRMFIRDDFSGASYRLLYEKQNPGQPDNVACTVTFGLVGDGLFSFGQESRSFTYPLDEWMHVMHIVDLDQNVLEFWINHSFLFSIPFDEASEPGQALSSLAPFGAINFGAGSGFTSYLIDNIAVRTTDPLANCQPEAERVCVKNGQSFDSECEAAKSGLYTEEEFGACVSICNYGGEFIFRDEGAPIIDSIGQNEAVPNLVYSTPEIITYYGGNVPYPLYGDIFIYENEPNGEIILNLTIGNVDVFLFECDCDASGCSSNYLGELSEFDGGDNLPGGFYYILVVSSNVGGTYGINVFPNNENCTLEDANDILGCGDTLTADFAFASNDFDLAEGNTFYTTCYGGIRTYEGPDKLYRVQIDEPSVIDFTLTTYGGGGGLFLYNYTCGQDCIHYTETSPFGGTSVLDSVTLSEGIYYLVIDQELTAELDSFTVEISCAPDANNDGFGIISVYDDGVLPPDCLLADDSEHQVGIALANPADYSSSDVFGFSIIDAAGNNFPGYAPGLAQTYTIGQDVLLFNLPEYTGDPGATNRCSFIAGDSLQLWIGREDDYIRQLAASYRPATAPIVDAEGRFTPDGTSQIVTFEDTGVGVTINMGTSVSFPSEGGEQPFSFYVDAGWTMSTESTWIDISDTSDPYGGPANLTIGVSPYDGFVDRVGYIRFETMTEPVFTQIIEVRQRGRCEFPNFILQASQNQICAGEAVTLSVDNLGPGPEDIYEFYWMDATAPGEATYEVMPLVDTDYSVLVMQATTGCWATASAAVSVEVSEAPDAPLVDPAAVAICATEAAVPLVATVGANQTVRWYAEPNGGMPISIGETFIPDQSGPYFAETLLLAGNGCASATRTEVPYEVRPQPVINIDASATNVCLGESVSLSTEVSPAGGNYNYSWSDGLGNADSAEYLPENTNPNDITVMITDGVCQAEAAVTITAHNEPSLTISQPTDANCAADLATYSVEFSTDGAPDVPPVGELVSLGGELFRIDGISVGTDFTLTVSNEYCNRAYGIDSPGCECPPNIPPPVNNSLTQDICADEPLPLLSVQVPGPDYSANWYNEAGQQVAGQTLSYQPTAAGVFTVETVLLDAPACVSSLQTEVEVQQYPELNVSTGLPNPGCEGQTVQLVAVASGGAGGPFHYQWGQGLPASPSVLYTINQAGAALIGLTVTDAGGVCTAETSVTVTGLEKPAFGEIGEPVCAPDLQSYQVIVTTDADQLQASAGTVTQQGDTYTIGNIPDDVNLQLTAVNFYSGATLECTTTINIPNPGCDCQEEEVAPPVVVVASVGACVGNTPPAFIAEEPGPNLAIDWLNDDLTVVQPNSLQFTPPSPGNYFARTRHTVNDCFSDLSETLIYQQVSPPEISLSADQTEACLLDEPISLFVVVTGDPGDLVYEWCDGLSGQGNTAQYAAETPGSFTACVSVSNDYCTSEAEIELTVHAPPTLAITTPSVADCAPDLQTYTLYFSTDGTPIVPDIGELFDEGNGNYRLEGIPSGQTIELGAENDANCSVMEAIPAPDCSCPDDIPAPIGGGDFLICGNAPFPSLTVTVDEDLYLVNWYDADNFQVASNTTSYQPQEEGTYYAEAQDLNAVECTSTSFATFTVEEVTAISVNASNDMSNCLGASFPLSAIAIGGSGDLTYTWSNGLPAQQNVTFTPEGPGTYALSLTVSDADGICTTTEEVIITAHPRPTVGITTTAAIDCAGAATGALQANASGGTPGYDPVWSTNAMTPNIGGLPAGDYSVTVTDANGCSGTATTILPEPAPITVTEAIVPITNLGNGMVEPGLITLEVSGGTGDYTFGWRDPMGFNISGETADTLSVDMEGMYSATITDENGCTYEWMMSVPVGSLEVHWERALRVFPNPTSGRLNLEFTLADRSEIRVRLLDALGRVHYEHPATSLQSGRLVVPTEALPSAVYWLQIRVDDAIIYRKVIRQ